MSRSLIYTVNANPQTVDANGNVALGTVIRRFGCNLNLVGNGIMVRGQGYYSVDAVIVAVPEAVGDITATLYMDGVPLPGATATGTATAVGDYVTLPIIGVDREMYCDSAGTLTCVLSAAATVNNIAVKVTKE